MPELSLPCHNILKDLHQSLQTYFPNKLGIVTWIITCVTLSHKTYCRTYTSPFRHIYPTNWAYRTYISPFTNIYPTKWAWITLSDNIDEIIISKGIESKPGFLFIANWFEKLIICGRDSRSDKNDKWIEFGRPPGLIKILNDLRTW